MWYKNAGTIFFRGQTDRILIARLRLHSMQRGKMLMKVYCIVHRIQQTKVPDSH